jgi:hypothetical protein
MSEGFVSKLIAMDDWLHNSHGYAQMLGKIS